MLGCYYQDYHDKAFVTLENSIELVKGCYAERKNVIGKCYLAAASKGKKMFAIQSEGKCLGSYQNDVNQTLDKLEKSVDCKNGKGGSRKGGAISVYQVREGCKFLSNSVNTSIYRNLLINTLL